jgi:parvulin-like peptidyl-prolyl isomerase
MAKPFEDAAFAQATNVSGPVVETEFGYHIIQVVEHLPAGMASKEEVSRALMNQKCDEVLRKYIGSLSQKANIKDNRPQKMMEPPMGMGMPPQRTGPAPAPAPAPKR